MSKSKKNVVDPDDIIATYGADVARWFMLSDSPPDRDVNGATRGVEGAWRFVQRLWRLVDEAAELASSAGRAAGLVRRATRCRCARRAHGALAKVSDGIEKLHFNVAVARIYEFANAMPTALARGAQGRAGRWPGRCARPSDPGLMIAPMMPHLAEECWRCWASPGWFRTDGPNSTALCVEDSVTLVVQVNGKKRGDVTVPRVAQNAEIEGAVLALDAVKLALGGKAVRKVIVVPMRIVNVVG